MTTEDEEQQAGAQDAAAIHQVGQPPDERQRGDVAEQESRDDRRGPLQLVDPETDAGHHVRQREDDDVGVGRREGYTEAGEREQQPRAR
ncbi:hypothetical protein MM440_01495 [Arsenicicoccus piscis]|uniref:Uncharacterized protein n=1 Tax=Arsenicicoccus piscis TaxID=673954 RepID=A0ABQ6HTU9_9MICO|nr:hypothetical protein [Arsenicicoccus piscis]MCH8626492.1 hypothetical protein [Arsenicicoccus piscis]GMA21128.1 hypothetical protein GCM10025862_31490 [Arsenicicoccus piscis]